MTEHILIGVAGILVCGLLAQWIAWRFKLPSILFLLLFGFVVGPVTGVLEPDALFGDLLMPIVSISVAVILFEGGLTLRLSELGEIAHVVRNLISIGVMTTWLSIAVLAHFLLQLNLTLSILLGAILVVTGPTVIGPLLRHIRGVGRVGNVVKWEGILNDPIGALLAVLVFEVALLGELHLAGSLILFSLLKTLFFGVVIAVFGAFLLAFLLKRYRIPDYLQQAVTLTLVILVFVVANYFQHESGLFAVTVMGITLANQKDVDIKRIVEFKENLRVLIISSLFILLAGRLQLSDLGYLNVNSLLFLAGLIFVVRPLAVVVSTVKSGLSWKERLFVAWMAPRGIVAAAISAIFALRLAQEGIAQTEYLVPLTFMVIVGTVGFYGLTATPLARWLKLAEVDPQGVLIIGAHAWARAIARCLQQQGIRVVLVDSNRANEYRARMEGFQTHYGSILSEHIFDELDLDGLGRLLALTSNDEANSLAAVHFVEIFGRSHVYQLPPEEMENEPDSGLFPQHLRGRYLFGLELNYTTIAARFAAGAEIKSTKLTEEFDYQAFRQQYKGSDVPLFLITESGALIVCTAEEPVKPEPGHLLIALVQENAGAGQTA